MVEFVKMGDSYQWKRVYIRLSLCCCGGSLSNLDHLIPVSGMSLRGEFGTLPVRSD